MAKVQAQRTLPVRQRREGQALLLLRRAPGRRGATVLRRPVSRGGERLGRGGSCGVHRALPRGDAPPRARSLHASTSSSPLVAGFGAGTGRLLDDDDPDAFDDAIFEAAQELDTPLRRLTLAQAILKLRDAGQVPADVAAAAVFDLSEGESSAVFISSSQNRSGFWPATLARPPLIVSPRSHIQTPIRVLCNPRLPCRRHGSRSLTRRVGDGPRTPALSATWDTIEIPPLCSCIDPASSSVENLAVDALDVKFDGHSVIGHHRIAEPVSFRCRPQSGMDFKQLLDSIVMRLSGDRQ